MAKSLFYYAGLVLAIMGLIGIISATGQTWIRYFVFILGLVLLFASSMRRTKI